MWDNELLTNELIQTQVKVQELRDHIGEMCGRLTPLNSQNSLTAVVISHDVLITSLHTKISELEREVFVLKNLGGTENI